MTGSCVQMGYGIPLKVNLHTFTRVLVGSPGNWK